MSERPEHAFTVDVEDWFHILDCPQSPALERYGSFESRIVRNARAIMDALHRHGVVGTFFVLGWVAEQYPQLVREIAARGHELGIHGYAHVDAATLSDEALANDTRRAFELVAQAAGNAPVGYRSPGGTLLPSQRWLFDPLLELGIRFDASVYPRRGTLAQAEGFPTVPYVIHKTGKGILWEFPSTTQNWLGVRWAFAEGGYLRLLPLGLVRGWFQEYERDGKAVSLCVHPREFDPAQPRLVLNPWKSWKTYVGIASLPNKIDSLLATFRFTTVGRILGIA